MSTQNKTYTVKGMHCENCTKTVEKLLKSVSGITAVHISLKNSSAEVISTEVISLSKIEAAFEGSGYSISEGSPSQWSKAASTFKKFAPLITLFAIAIVITIITAAIQHYPGFHIIMDDFMGGFFLAFGTVKVFGWKNFPAAFRRYDYIGSKSKLYADIYPVIEIFLAILFLSGIWLAAAGIIALIVMVSNLIGVRRVLLNGGIVQCACLGGFFNIPITLVTFAEDLLMALMAIHTLLFTARF
jgi:copper chaperone CopZ